jgi:hypothetical protein
MIGSFFLWHGRLAARGLFYFKAFAVGAVAVEDCDNYQPLRRSGGR